MNVKIDGHDIEVTLDGSYTSGGRHMPEQFPDVEIVGELPEGVRHCDVEDKVRERIRSEERKSRAQKSREAKAAER